MWHLVHSVQCRATTEFAWQFWTAVETWAAVDPAIDSVVIDGSFVTGARGTTVTARHERTAWLVAEVREGVMARIDFPAPGAVLSAEWTFQSTPAGGCLLTQHMSLSGERADEYEGAIASEMERGVPTGMVSLATAIDQAFTQAAGEGLRTDRP